MRWVVMMEGRDISVLKFMILTGYSFEFLHCSIFKEALLSSVENVAYDPLEVVFLLMKQYSCLSEIKFSIKSKLARPI